VKTLRAPFVRFCLVGTIGFCIDASVLQIVVQHWGVNPYLGRVLSYLVAATATWGLNRRFTFGSGGAEQWQHQWVRYVIVNAVGAGVNYGTYAACVWSFALVRQYLILGVAVGSIAALAFNFTASRHLVFRER
jgi:putative flippase GtrA